MAQPLQTLKQPYFAVVRIVCLLLASQHIAVIALVSAARASSSLDSLKDAATGPPLSAPDPRSHPFADFVLRWAGPEAHQQLEALQHLHRGQPSAAVQSLLAAVRAGLARKAPTGSTRSRDTTAQPTAQGAATLPTYLEGWASAQPARVEPVPDSVRLPVLLVPPLTGVQLDVKLDKPSSSPHWWCPRQRDWATLWISSQVVLPGQFSCVAENLRCEYNASLRRCQPVPGVKVVPTDGFDSSASGLNPMGGFKQQLISRGWTEGVDLHTHDYDWRLSPLEWSQPDVVAWKDLKRQVEWLYLQSGRKPVVLVGLSLGASYSSSFLASGYVEQSWKDEHVAALLSISGVFGGTPASTYDIIAGRLQGLEAVLPSSDVRLLMQAVPAISWTSPHPEVFGSQPIIINTALGRNFSSVDIHLAYTAANAHSAAAQVQEVLGSNPQYRASRPPGVKVFCLYSRGLPSAQTITFSTPDFTDAGQVSYVDGDITVPLASLAACESWSLEPGHPPVVSRVWDGVMHAGILMQGSGMAFALETIISLGYLTPNTRAVKAEA
ncbi:hypothetical protein QJQ45_027944 [Haematococcus lacustris]|nr:hypothetical protein QJQ45_027944 [Haematococcus lacustris]